MSKLAISRDCCPACGSRQVGDLRSIELTDPVVWTFLESYYQGRLPKEQFIGDSLVAAQCFECSLIFQRYILDDSGMLELYEEWIDRDKSFAKKSRSEVDLPFRYATEMMKIARLTKKRPADTLVLDFGMGWGAWLQVATSFGFRAMGAELSEERIEHARSRGLHVCDDIDKLDEGTFDFIYSNQVFEHLPEPLFMLRKLARLTRTGGFIQIRVPNGADYSRKITAATWKASKDAFHPLEHINTFCRKSLSRMGEVAGLRVVDSPDLIWGYSSRHVLLNILRRLRRRRPSTDIYFRKP